MNKEPGANKSANLIAVSELVSAAASRFVVQFWHLFIIVNYTSVIGQF